jgi:tRNA G10  N-methylase Trm11
MDVARRLRPITKEEALKSYQDLKDGECPKSIPTSREGTKALDYFFFRHRLAAKTKRHISFLNMLKNKETFAYIRNKTRKVKKYGILTRKSANEELRNQYSVFQLYYGTINQFRPIVAKTLYCMLKPKKAILDFSSGWGGRCMAAMALGIPYIGFDANKKLESSYKSMIQTLDPNANVKMTFKPSETIDFSKYSYDLVFTSPPYFMLEEYQGMPQYKQKQGFLDDFFVPVLKNVWKHLESGGHLALNMPVEMYDSVKKCLPPVTKKLKMRLSNRHATEAARGEALKEAASDPFEYIYIWKKKGNAAFDTGKAGCGEVP